MFDDKKKKQKIITAIPSRSIERPVEQSARAGGQQIDDLVQGVQHLPVSERGASVHLYESEQRPDRQPDPVIVAEGNARMCHGVVRLCFL